MTPTDITDVICHHFAGVVPKASWGENALFYNPGQLLAHGVYFCTLKLHDGDNDKASELNRAGVFRVALGLTPATYASLFGKKPARPLKGGIVATGHDFTAMNVLIPHPVYAWMGWAQILSPSRERFDELLPLIGEAHAQAVERFNKKTSVKPAKGDA
ncbi:MAG: hypothetical protein IPN53_15125 [Comamonadaceae bacterium]|nr:hypothetical protein [Comamonadaceae bacterium]